MINNAYERLGEQFLTALRSHDWTLMQSICIRRSSGVFQVTAGFPEKLLALTLS